MPETHDATGLHGVCNKSLDTQSALKPRPDRGRLECTTTCRQMHTLAAFTAATRLLDAACVSSSCACVSAHWFCHRCIRSSTVAGLLFFCSLAKLASARFLLSLISSTACADAVK